MKTAFIFSGQGAQHIGMGKELYENFKICKEVFDTADDALGFKISDMCFYENNELDKTENTQPAILTTSIAIYKLLEELSITCDYYAGLSLGEYSALVASEALDFKATVQLVKKRGRFMTEAVKEGEGGMSAIIGLSKEQVIQICEEASVYGVVTPANYNMPGQIVIAGNILALENAEKLAKERSAKLVVRLKVSGPFHTSLLQPASDRLNVELKKISINNIKKPVITNLTGKEIPKKEDIIDILTKQVMSPVLWEDTINYLVEQGVNRFVEVGPGKVLSGFVKKINKNVEIYNVCDMDSLEKLRSCY